MSIADTIRRDLRSFRSLIDFDASRGFHIKDLKDLDNETTRVSIDIKVLKDLKRANRDQEGSPTNNDRGGLSPALR